MKKAIEIPLTRRAAVGFHLLFACMILLAAFLCGGARGEAAELYRTEEITIPAGDFTIVGDLYIPVQGERHPLVVWVHGSGPLTRQMMAPLLKPQIEVFLKAGFAFFIDDIPGAGSSKGAISSVYRDRAMILCKEVETLRGRPDIVAEQVGVAGHSQAGVVMPLALQSACGVAFMIAEACPAENAAEQESYLLEKYLICEGYPPEEARRAGQLLAQRYYARNYKDYREAAEFINNHPSAKQYFTHPLVAENEFAPRKESSPMFLDPMKIVSETRIPVLAMFGDRDNNVDPVQGAEAYEEALKAAGNEFYRVETIPGANHMLYSAETGCALELMAQIKRGEPDFVPAALTVLADWLEQLKGRFDSPARHAPIR